MEALYWSPPTADELAGTGLLAKHYKPPQVDLWPENEQATDLFIRYSTQWRVGASGVVGLDYSVIQRELLDVQRMDADQYQETMASVRVIESVAMKHLNET